MQNTPDPVVMFDGLGLHALGWNLLGMDAFAAKQLRGGVNVAVVFAEHIEMSLETLERMRRYELFIAGSTWQEEFLTSLGMAPVKTVLQGVDPTFFHPGPRSGLLDDLFLVFSGGKMEFRKGQDLVLKAFAAFSQRHPEARLVTAWDSPWPDASRSFTEEATGLKPPQPKDGQVDVVGWATANGVAEHQLINLGKVSHERLGRILRDMDVAVFPNRGEAGTNLVAMECMACGVPTILSANSGHLDLLGENQAIALTRQTIAVTGPQAGWGESDVEEVVEALEAVWRDRARAAEFGRRGADFMSRLSWRNQIGMLADTLKPFWSA